MADERVTKSDVLDALHFYKVNADSSGSGGGGLLPIIQITCDSSDITVTKSGVNYPATSHVDNVHTFTVPEFGTYTVTATSAEYGRTNTAFVDVDVVKVYTVSLAFALRYGYRIKKAEADPYARVEYLYDAEGMTPAHMDFDNGVFDYGDWGGIWFVQDNKPCMLRSNGTVDYYLNPNDYSKKADGTASDVANENYDGNAMAQFPLCWIYRYEDNDYLYEIVSNAQYDENYKAYAHTDASGNIKEYFYHSLFGASGSASRLRSLSGQSVPTLSTEQEIAGATANGNGWYIGSWSQHELIRTLLVLIGKSTNTQVVFGNGNSSGSFLSTGTIKDKGQFFGYNSNNQQVKTFHVEGLWGDQWLRTAGFINSGGTIYVKMTPEGTGYRVNDTDGYINTNIVAITASESYISQMNCSEYGMIPTAVTGSASTYFCDVLYVNNTRLDYLLVGGSAHNTTNTHGAFALDISGAPSLSYVTCGCALAYV